MSKVDENIKKALELINNRQFNATSSLPSLERDELKNIILMCEEDGYISHRSPKGKGVIEGFMDGTWSLQPSTFVTRAGSQFLEGVDRNTNQIGQTFNIQNVKNSALGNYNTVYNYSNEPVQELEGFINTLEDVEDQKTGKELLKTLKDTEMKPGYLNKFENFLAKYPKTIDLIASFTTSVAMGIFKN